MKVLPKGSSTLWYIHSLGNLGCGQVTLELITPESYYSVEY